MEFIFLCSTRYHFTFINYREHLLRNKDFLFVDNKKYKINLKPICLGGRELPYGTDDEHPCLFHMGVINKSTGWLLPVGFLNCHTCFLLCHLVKQNEIISLSTSFGLVLYRYYFILLWFKFIGKMNKQSQFYCPKTLIWVPFLCTLLLAVFWRAHRGNIHYVSSGIANNIFGGIFVLILSVLLSRYDPMNEVWVSLI